MENFSCSSVPLAASPVLHSHMWLVATVWHAVNMEHFPHCSKFYFYTCFPTCVPLKVESGETIRLNNFMHLWNFNLNRTDSVPFPLRH